MEGGGEEEKPLIFNGPYTQHQTAILLLKNPTTGTVTYKVKTNRNRRLNAIPPCGYVGPCDEKRILTVSDPFDETHLLQKNPPDRVTVVLATISPHLPPPPEEAADLWTHNHPLFPTHIRRVPFTVTYRTDNDTQDDTANSPFPNMTTPGPEPDTHTQDSADNSLLFTTCLPPEADTQDTPDDTSTPKPNTRSKKKSVPRRGSTKDEE